MTKITKWEKYLSAICTLVLGFTLIWSCSNNNPTTTTAGKLILALDTNIIDSDNPIITGTITSAVLYSFPNSPIKTASVSNGIATFDLTGIAAGNYFFVINGFDSLNYREPTYIADPTKTEYAYVGRMERQSVIIYSPGDTICKLKTDPQAQGENQIVAFSSGQGLGRWAWDIVFYKLGYTETHHLDDGSVMAHHNVSSDAILAGHNYFDALGGNNNDSLANHGSGPSFGLGSHSGDRAIDSANVVQACGTYVPGKPGCHYNFWVKPPSYSQISDSNGFCFTCHYGFQGDGGWDDNFPHGILDPAQ